eukprot:gene2337-743_t
MADWSITVRGTHYPAWREKEAAAASLGTNRDRVVLGVARPFFSKDGAWRRYYGGYRAACPRPPYCVPRGEVAPFVLDGFAELQRSVFAAPRPCGVPLDLVLDVEGVHGTSVGEARQAGEREIEQSPLAELRAAFEARAHPVERVLVLDATRQIERERHVAAKWSYHIHVVFRNMYFARIGDMRHFLAGVIPDRLASGEVDPAIYRTRQEIRMAWCVSVKHRGAEVLHSQFRPLAWEQAAPALAAE